MKKTGFLFLILFLISFVLPGCKQKDSEAPGSTIPVTINVGHVGHDHHTTLFVALDNAEQFSKESGINVKTIEEFKFYELFDKGQKIADMKIVKVGGGSKMPTALAQNVIEVGFGGVAPVLACVDSGAPVKLISPLHYKGDMFVVKPDFKAKTWEEFVAMAKAAEKPIRIGYKDPVAVAKIVFEEALKHEGITFGGDLSQQDLKVHMINVQGGGKLNVALSGDLVDGYVGNNPFPAIAVEKGIGRIICDLEELPPGTFRNHPCCCIAANSQIMKEKSEAIIDLLVLFLQATETINKDTDIAVASVVKWIGTSEQVEKMSIPTSGYSMEPSKLWNETMNQWIKAMDGMEIFKDKLQGLTPEQVAEAAYDLSLLEQARKKLEQRRTENK
ncbi:MAG: ABC transporter substrate-binding protein [Sedimentisphaerales bacterium]|nr:ABC transporter substrate-binding protein [Sedimentisphaerales bacterium]